MKGIRRWVSVKEIAGHLGVSKETVYRWVDGRGMPAHRVGRLMKFQIAEVDDWVRAKGADLSVSETPFRRGTGAHGMSSPGEKRSNGRSDRAALLLRYGQAVVHLENLRSRTPDSEFRGEVQQLLGQLSTVRARLETLPAARLSSLSTLGDLEAMERAVDAASSAESAAVRKTCIETARNALTHVAGQLA